MRRPTIQELAASVIATADRSHLEPPPMPKTEFKRTSRFLSVGNVHRVYSHPLLLDKPINRRWSVRAFDRSQQWVVDFLADEKAYRQARGVWVPNNIELSNENLASLSGQKCESVSDTRTLPRKSGVNITFGKV